MVLLELFFLRLLKSPDPDDRFLDADVADAALLVDLCFSEACDKDKGFLDDEEADAKELLSLTLPDADDGRLDEELDELCFPADDDSF